MKKGYKPKIHQAQRFKRTVCGRSLAKVHWVDRRSEEEVTCKACLNILNNHPSLFKQGYGNAHKQGN